MRVQARWVDPAVKVAEEMLAASKLIATADVGDGHDANAWLAAVVPQHQAECPAGWVPVVCVAGSPWFDPAAD